MASLTETAYHTRRGINWTILTVIIYLILRIFWSLLLVLWAVLFPPRALPPNHAFGKLPKLSFPQAESSPTAQLSYTLQTISGSLPQSSNSATVYFMPKQAANLLAISKTQDFAKKLLFDPNPFQETRTVYRFDDPITPLRKLRYDIVSNNFILRYGYEQDTGIFSESGSINDSQKLIEESKNYLNDGGISEDDFQRGEQKVSYFKLVGNTLVQVPNVSQSNATRVDFFRGPVNKFKLMTSNPSEGQIQFLFSPALDKKKRIIELIYTYWPIDYETSATYSIRSSGEAWQELQNGRAYIAKYPTNNTNNILIRNIYLAYYDSFEPQTYLQPIFVFEGDQDFKAYVPAISQEWIE